MRKAWPGASGFSAYLSRGSTCTRGGPRPLLQSGLGGFESAGVDKKKSAATHGRREAQHHSERARGDTPGWTQSWWSPRKGPGRAPPRWTWSWWSPRGGPRRTPLDGCGHGGHPGEGSRGCPWVDTVMVVTPGGPMRAPPRWTWSWWSPRGGPERIPPDGRGHRGHPGEAPGDGPGWTCPGPTQNMALPCCQEGGTLKAPGLHPAQTGWQGRWAGWTPERSDRRPPPTSQLLEPRHPPQEASQPRGAPCLHAERSAGVRPTSPGPLLQGSDLSVASAPGKEVCAPFHRRHLECDGASGCHGKPSFLQQEPGGLQANPLTVLLQHAATARLCPPTAPASVPPHGGELGQRLRPLAGVHAWPGGPQETRQESQALA